LITSFFFFFFLFSFFPREILVPKGLDTNNNSHGIDKMEFDVDGGGGVSWQCCKVGTSHKVPHCH